MWCLRLSLYLCLSLSLLRLRLRLRLLSLERDLPRDLDRDLSLLEYLRDRSLSRSRSLSLDLDRLWERGDDLEPLRRRLRRSWSGESFREDLLLRWWSMAGEGERRVPTLLLWLSCVVV